MDKWQNVGDGKVNLLMEFYRNPEVGDAAFPLATTSSIILPHFAKRYAYTFQNYVFLTRMVQVSGWPTVVTLSSLIPPLLCCPTANRSLQERESYSKSMCRLLERSVFSDRMVFVRAVHKSKFLSDTELAIYDSWFEPVLHTLPTLVPSGFIYLRAQPETCHRRMQRRNRNEETSVQIEYLRDLHQNHEDWLWSGGELATSSQYLHVPSTQQVGFQYWRAYFSRFQHKASYRSRHQTLINKGPSGLDIFSSSPPTDALRLSVAQPSSEQQRHGSILLPPAPDSLKSSLYILNSAKGAHMLPQLHQVLAFVPRFSTGLNPPF